MIKRDRRSAAVYSMASMQAVDNEILAEIANDITTKLEI
jgi:hypothetical protein